MGTRVLYYSTVRVLYSTVLRACSEPFLPSESSEREMRGVRSSLSAATSTAATDKAARVAAKKARKLARRAQRKALNLAFNPEAGAVLENAVSCAHRPLPRIPRNLAPAATTICLMYQYKEPAWTRKQHKAVLNNVNRLAKEHHVAGRGRCAPEGLNCTLTGPARSDPGLLLRRCARGSPRSSTPPTSRSPTASLRRPVPKALTLRKEDELVGYGLAVGEKAPSLSRHAGKHLEADEYHETDEAEGHGDHRRAQRLRERDRSLRSRRRTGATLLDPKMRSVYRFPQMAQRARDQGQAPRQARCMMYCTGGIRCERATALLNQMTEAEADGSFKPKDVVMARGGIERYLKTFPKGGFWKGKNYLFDKRMEQVPSKKSTDALAADVESECCVCHAAYASYRGQYKCAGVGCAVPVIVCPDCVHRIEREGVLVHDNPARGIDGTGGVGVELKCPLCVEGYATPADAPDLVGQKRKLGLIRGGRDAVSGKLLGSSATAVTSKTGNRMLPKPSRRLYIGKMPLTMTATALKASLRQCIVTPNTQDKDMVESIHWIVDKATNLYYGAAFVWMKRLQAAEKVVAFVREKRGLDIVQLKPAAARKAHGNAQWGTCKRHKVARRRKAKVNYAPLKDGEIWPMKGHEESEAPPLGF